MGLFFGTAGIPVSSPARDTAAGVRHLRAIGLDCMEVQFVRGVHMGEAKAKEVRAAAEESNLRLSVHAPYYINLNSRDRSKVKSSREWILKASRIGYLMGARRIVFHAAYNHGDPVEVVYDRVKRNLGEVLNILDSEGVKVILSPEITGKPSQFGSFEELLRLSADIKEIRPCFDFSHLYAREGGRPNKYEEFSERLEEAVKILGRKHLKDLHVHLSGIEFTPKGEKRHLTFEESEFDIKCIIKAFKEFGVGGNVICESPSLEQDALLLKRIYK